MGRTKRNTKYAVAAGTTWFTAGTIAANDQFIPQSVDRISLDGELYEEEGAGFIDVEEMHLTRQVANPTFQVMARRTNAEWKFVASLFGDDTLTGAGPYVHTMNWQEESTINLTVAKMINGADIIEWQSLRCMGWTFEHAGNGLMRHTFRTLGDTINIAGDATNDATSLGNATLTSKALLLPFRNCRLRMNAQGGGALGSGDVIKVDNLVLTIDRPMDAELLTQAASDGTEEMSDAPVQNRHTQGTVSFTVTDYTTIALLDDLEDETEYKMDLNWDAIIATVNYDILIELGRLHPMPQDISLAEGTVRYPLTRTFRIKKPASVPTGMATANFAHLVLQDNANIDYAAT